MTKQSKFYLLLIGLSIIIIGGLIFSSKLQKINNVQEVSKEKQNQAPKVNLAQLKADYEKNTKIIFGEYDNFLAELQNTTTTPSKDDSLKRISGYKERLLALTVPEEFRDLHLNLVLSLSKLEIYFNEGKKEEKTACNDLVEKIKNKNTWLIN